MLDLATIHRIAAVVWRETGILPPSRIFQMPDSDEAIAEAFAELLPAPKVRGKQDHNKSRKGKIKKRNKPRKMTWSHKIDDYQAPNTSGRHSRDT